jgi:titin
MRPVPALGAVPGAPLSLSRSGNSSASLTISWSAPANAAVSGPLTYSVEAVNAANSNDSAATTTSSTSVQFQVTGGYTYNISVTATGPRGTGPAATSQITMPSSAPAAPTGVTATGFNGYATMTWTPGYNGGSAISTHTVQTSSNNGQTWDSGFTTLESTPSAYTPPLASGEYKFRVASTNAVGTGAFSAASNAVTVTNASTPAAIATVTATTSTTSQSAIDLSWDAPDNGGATITGYNIYLSTDGGMSYSYIANTANTTYEYIEAYRGGQSRSFDVRAVNIAGVAPTASMYGSANLSDSPPSAPTSLTATALADFDLRVEFTSPAFTGNQSITDYEIGYQRPASAESFTSTFGDLDGDYTIYLTSMESGSAYDVRVRAINSAGNGEWSSVVTSPVIGDVPSASPYTSPSTSTVSQGAVTLSIEVPSGYGPAVTSYSVQCDLDGSFSSPISTETYTDQPVSGTFSREITGLAGGVLHYFRVRFVNAIGNGAWSSSSNTYASSTPPGQVTGFSVTPNYGTSQWDMNWTEPSSGGSAITGYEVSEASADTFASPDTYYPTPGSSHSRSASPADQTRWFRIRAVNAIGNGEWSTAVSSYYDTPTVPSAPTINNAYYDAANDQTFIEYTFPADDGNSAITAYTFYFSGNATSPFQNNLGAGTGVAWFYQDYAGAMATMSATNSVGQGPESSAVEVF